MRKQNLAILGTVLATLLAWWIGYSLIGNREGKATPQPGPGAVEITSPDRGAEDQIEDAVEGPEDAQDAEDAVDAEEDAAKPLRFINWEPDTSGEEGRICAEFSAALGLNETEIRDYIDITPAAQWSANVSGRRLCLTGLDFAQTYQVTIKEGVAATSGGSLSRNIEFEASFGDRPAVVRFVGDGIILPRIGAQGLAIETVNIDTLNVEIYRVPERILARRSPEAGESIDEDQWSYEGQNSGADVRERIWSGTVEPKQDRNQAVTTVLPVSSMIGQFEPGAYVVRLERATKDEDVRPARAWRWLVVTDLALTSYRSASGLHVTARSLDSAALRGGVKLTLIAENNRVLGEAITDRNGHAKFDAPLLAGTGPARPVMITASGNDQDFAILDLQRSPLDLSEFDVAGRNVPGQIDPYLFTDRGVYRPGETVNFTAMIRDARGKAAPRPGTFILRKPNGLESFTRRFTAEELLSGAFVLPFDLPSSAPRGQWRAQIKLDGIDTVHSAAFAVEDFVPQKIKVDITPGDAPLKSGEIRDITVATEFLYGGAGADLQSELSLRVRQDPAPFVSFKDYYFNRDDETFREEFVAVGQELSDAKGLAKFTLNASDLPLEGRAPLRAELLAGVAEPGGRYVQESARLPIRQHDVYLGIRPNFDGNSAHRNTPANFEFVAVNADGEAIALDGVELSLFEIDWSYNWYRQYGEWRYVRREITTPVTTRKFDLSAKSRGTFSTTQNWGDYRLEVKHPQSGAIAVYDFYVGWRRNRDTDRPDMLSLAMDDKAVTPGGKITLAVNAPYAGKGELVIANEAVLSVQPINIPAGQSELSLRADPDWGGGVYAMVTLYTPRSAQSLPVPRRAVGVQYVPVDRGAQKLGFSIEAPDVVRPRQTQTVTLNFDGNIPANSYVTLAAMDEGVLRITKYQSPSPETHYFGKPAFALDVYDDYGRVLNPNMGQPAIAQSGGDGLGGEGLSTVPIKTVTLYSGAIKVTGRKVKIPVELPDFNGEVRLMAVAWSEDKMGSAARAMKVRDAVPADLYLPRFLAPGDEALATVALNNVDGDNGAYKWAASSQGLTDGASGQASLSKGAFERAGFPVKAQALGVSDVTLDVKGPGRYATQSVYQIETRSPFLPEDRRVEILIQPGETQKLPSNLFGGLLPGSASASLSVTRSPRLDPAPYVASLARYPYGCLEQTISSGLPLLYAGKLGGVPGQDPAMLRRKMQGAVYKVADRMSPDGTYGLWSQGDGYAYSWMGAYATEFLQRAAEEGYYVPEDAMTTSYKALREMSRMPRYSGLDYYDYRRAQQYWSRSYLERRRAESAAYAHYVLARGGEGDLSQMRYFFDNKSATLQTAQSHAHIGAALALMGDKSRASRAFQRAVNALGFEDEQDYYQSKNRDAAIIAALAYETGMSSYAPPAVEYLDKNLPEPNRMHTQEKGRLILAFAEFAADDNPITVSAANAPELAKGQTVQVNPSGNWASIAVENKGNSPVYLVAQVTGHPQDVPRAMAEGYKLDKVLYSMDGKRMTQPRLAKGEQAIIVVSFSSDTRRSRQTVIADLLPAGFEIETILKPADGKMENNIVDGPFSFVGEISDLQVAEARDDRFVGAVETRGRDEYRVAYIVRAVTAGDFVFPGAVIEDMYRPGDMARSPASRLSVLSANEG